MGSKEIFEQVIEFQKRQETTKYSSGTLMLFETFYEKAKGNYDEALVTAINNLFAENVSLTKRDFEDLGEFG